jgi:hypothetical protein
LGKDEEWIIKHYPELSKMGKSHAAYDELARIIVEAWEAIDQDYVDNLIGGNAEAGEDPTGCKRVAHQVLDLES